MYFKSQKKRSLKLRKNVLQMLGKCNVSFNLNASFESPVSPKLRSSKKLKYFKIQK